MRASPVALFTAFSAVLLLAGCATAYHPANVGGGYREAQLERNVFRVSFEGNLASTQEATNRMALLRSAEVARDHGYPWFTASAAATGTAGSIAFTTVRIPASTITIVCYLERPETRAIVYEADVLIATAGR